MTFREAFGLLKQTFNEWSEDRSPRLAAALAYYTVFSIAPLLFIAIAIVGLVFADANERVLAEVSGMIGETGAGFIRTTVQNAGPTGNSVMATMIGVVVLLFGASGLFGALQDALNTIWEVQPRPGQGIWATIRQRLFSFAMVAVAAFLLLASLMATTVISAMIKYFQEFLPGADFLWQIVNFAVGALIASGVFALVFKVIPDVVIRWRDVLPGALVTGFLFTIGQMALGFYLGFQSTASTYGAAGSLIVVLIWVYYTSQILFFGAEFTQVYARHRGSPIVPARNAVALTEEARAQQGIPHADVLADAVARADGRPVRKQALTELPAVAPRERPREVAEHPIRSLGAAFLVGAILGARRLGSRMRQRRGQQLREG